MGVFGMQLVCTMVMCTVLSKVIPHWSPAQWLLCNTGLSYYLHPTDDQLRDKKKTSSSKNNTKSSENTENGCFTVLPKNLDVNLQKTSVTKLDVFQLRFFSDYQWLIDFSVCALIVYAATEVYLYLSPGRDEVNLSMVWCLLLLLFILKVLFSITLVYFKASAGDGEKALVVLALFCYLLLAMMVLVISETKLELGLDEAYTAFNASAAEFMKSQEITSVGVMSKMAFKGCVAVACAVLGACLAFPGLRLGKMHWDAVRLQSCRRWLQLLLHCSFMAPALVSLLWVRPLARQYLVIITWPGYTKPILSADSFGTVRVVCVLVACALRLVVLPVYLQAYLDMARIKLEEQRSHAGKTTNKNIQRQVASVFYYLCVVALQYVLPLLLSIVLALMLKTLGGLHWEALRSPRHFVSSECGLDELAETVVRSAKPHTATAAISRLAASTEATHAISSGVEQLRKVLVPEIWLGLLGFSLWWSVTCWFVSGLFGLLYQRYFTVG
ncbi:Transmembrane protein 161A/B [Trinorchestia longiramus]|nr:Transmembrane protein 161A/B [Trinorchestia longiramus]